jgi:hypothetical protein
MLNVDTSIKTDWMKMEKMKQITVQGNKGPKMKNVDPTKTQKTPLGSKMDFSSVEILGSKLAKQNLFGSKLSIFA